MEAWQCPAQQSSVLTELLTGAENLKLAVAGMRSALARAEGSELGAGLIKVREVGIDALEAVFAEGLHRFDEPGEYAADGALGIVPWLRWKCKLSGSGAAERVTISRQLEELPETLKAFASGNLGYQHVCFMARTAEHVGASTVRRADALLELARIKSGGSGDGAGPRPHLVIRASLETLVGTPGAGPGELEWGGTIPAETVRRIACDAALTRITGRGELDFEISRASRTIPSSVRRALVFRDHGCVAPGCGRPPKWTDAHHLKHWVDGGETTMSNLVLLCRSHHHMVHEEGWTLGRSENSRWTLTRPVAPHARSA